MSPRVWCLLCAPLVLLAATQLPSTSAYTAPESLAALSAFRDAMAPKSRNWAQAVSTWTCPTPAAKSDAPCDPCGKRGTMDGLWFHAHCRGLSRGWGESGDGTPNGLVTNMHITDVGVDGPVPREMCLFPELREFDFDGGHLSGPFPDFLAECFPKLEELDLSYNRLTGTLPKGKLPPLLSEFKVEFNNLIGTIPPEILLQLPRLRRFQTEGNTMWGPIPQEFRLRNATLAQFEIAGNNYSGDLSALAGSHLMIATVHENPQLCGMVPASVRYAKGYNPAGTKLGRPC